MKYTNGFDLDEVLDALRGRIGWAEGEGVVRLFNSFHPICTEKNLRDVQPDETLDAAGWDAEKARIETGVIQRCLSAVFNRPEYIEQVLLHNRIRGSVNQLVTPNGLFCGIRIRIAPDFGKTVQVKRVILLFEADATFDLYLFADGNPEPLQHYGVSAVAGVPTPVDLQDCLLKYDGESTTFYLGYFQSDLAGVRAIRELVTFSQSRVFAADHFTAAETDVQRFDQVYVTYGYDTHGINALIMAFRDYTALIKDSAHLFDEVIGLSMVAYVIEQILCTTRSNVTERLLKDDAARVTLQYYLEGTLPAMGVAKTEGLKAAIDAKIDQVRKAFNPMPKAQTVSVC